MKYIKRIVLILFLVIMISGCSVDYSLKINKDLSINEKITASENTDRMKSRTNLDVNQSVRYLYNIYKREDMNDDSYSIISKDSNTAVTVNNSYKSIKEYSDKFDNDIFKQKNNYKDKKNVVIELDQTDLIDSKSTNRYVYDKINITIEVPFEVKESNADSVKGNRYTWYVSKDTKELKKIYIKFDGERVKNTVSFKFFSNNSVSVGYGYIVIGVIGLAIIIALLVINYNNKKNNKM